MAEESDRISLIMHIN